MEIELDLAKSFEAFRLAEGAYMSGTPASSKIAARQFVARIAHHFRNLHKEQANQANLRGRIDELKTARNVLTGSEDFRVEPGVNLKLTMGQIGQLRGYLDRQIAELQVQLDQEQ